VKGESLGAVVMFVGLCEKQSVSICMSYLSSQRDEIEVVTFLDFKHFQFFNTVKAVKRTPIIATTSPAISPSLRLPFSFSSVDLLSSGCEATTLHKTVTRNTSSFESIRTIEFSFEFLIEGI
jgi:hypothetical protein